MTFLGSSWQKMKIPKFLFLMIPLMALIGCATTYQKESVFTNGYSDFRASEDTFVVTFRANEHTPKEDVFTYALQRCAELTLKNGFRYFAVIEESSKGRGLHYPSVRLHIQCFHSEPAGLESIDAGAL
jgi:hypothetical protein